SAMLSLLLRGPPPSPLFPYTTLFRSVSSSLEVLAEIGGKVQEEALKAGYGPTIRADAVRKLVDSVVNFQTRSVEIIAEMRELATKNSEEIRQAVEDGKKRISRLAAEGNALMLAG